MGLKYDVISPFAGTIERIRFQAGDRVEEGEVIFTLVGSGRTVDILSPVTGYANGVEVEQGEKVIAGMILAAITYLE
ncbi:biotin/lipoyl-binding protein [Brevibacillus choshinensis]|uniref:Biotin/lipoyl-binding protein n=1 Tax=Brevibacillus choshinensis TaxID=54911 RepID=A0ABX7FJT7_BRECH|nr:biotin/lipoyl-binding protein [Brevibacillus choshinensis]QRG66483.1 biotin/lipoyl-binding protein [Brevibacillus choshinensis]